MSEHLLVEDHDGIRLLSLNRPESRNAMDAPLRRALIEAFADADADAEIRAVVLTGVDPVFSAGVDFKQLEPQTGPMDPFAVNPGRAARTMRTPMICAVNGACVSGALEIALSASFIVASDRARFADTHARLGVVPTWGLTALLPHAVGVRKAREMSMTGNFVGADEALRIGLVNQVVAHEELVAVALRLAADIAPTAAVGEILGLYELGADLPLSAALAAETTHSLGKTLDVAAFSSAGSATAARGRDRD